MSRYIDADKLEGELFRDGIAGIFLGYPRRRKYTIGEIRGMLNNERIAPTADVVEVRHDFNVGDFCLYGFTDGNKSLAIVEIVKILDDERGIAEVGFLKVIRDNTGNGYFNYLFNKGGTMNASFRYLKNITPKIDEGENNEG